MTGTLKDMDVRLAIFDLSLQNEHRQHRAEECVRRAITELRGVVADIRVGLSPKCLGLLDKLEADIKWIRENDTNSNG